MKTESAIYSAVLLDHFRRPRNVGLIENATNVGIAGAPEDGDVIQLSMVIKRKVIVEAKAQVLGCPVAIAVGSVLTEIITGMDVGEIATIKNETISQALGGIPARKFKCSLLAERVIKAALE